MKIQIFNNNIIILTLGIKTQMLDLRFQSFYGRMYSESILLVSYLQPFQEDTKREILEAKFTSICLYTEALSTRLKRLKNDLKIDTFQFMLV